MLNLCIWIQIFYWVISSLVCACVSFVCSRYGFNTVYGYEFSQVKQKQMKNPLTLILSVLRHNLFVIHDSIEPTLWAFNVYRFSDFRSHSKYYKPFFFECTAIYKYVQATCWIFQYSEQYIGLNTVHGNYIHRLHDFHYQVWLCMRSHFTPLPFGKHIQCFSKMMKN